MSSVEGSKTNEEGNCCQNGVFVPGIPPCLDGKCDDYVCFLCNKACGREKERGCLLTCMDQNYCCRAVGGVGLDCVDKRRGPLMMCLSVLSVIQMVACVYACVGLARDAGSLQASYWAKATATEPEGFDLTLYIGVASVASESNGETDTFDWSEACEEDSPMQAYCTECKDATSPIYTSAIMTTVAKMGQFLTDIQRSTARGDVNCQKFMGVFTGFVATATTLMAFQTFNDYCYKEIDGLELTSTSGDSVKLSVTQGPGFLVMLVMVFLGLPDGIGHLLLRVPADARNRSPYGFPNNLPGYGPEDEVIKEDPETAQNGETAQLTAQVEA